MRMEIQFQNSVQCPYSGGPSVYQARALIRLINDTIDYNVDDVCGLLGIYRVQNVKSENSSKELKVIPNPSNGNVMLVFSGMIGNDIHLEINDVLRRRVIGRIISNLTNIYQLQLPDLQNGIYSLKLRDKQGNHLTEKIIITK